MARGTTTARGYGNAHQQLRKTWARHVAAGIVDCARCGQPIQPNEPWDLGHVDGDKTRYLGPEHRRCNRATSTHKAARTTGASPCPRCGQPVTNLNLNNACDRCVAKTRRTKW